MELKFRVWNKKDRVMEYPERLVIERCVDRSEEENQKNAVLMMSSGVKDANGNDIYEGDVLAGTYDYPSEGWYDTGEGIFHICDVVRFDNSAFRIDGFLLSEAGSFLRIAGNIYENEELSTEDGRDIVAKEESEKHHERETLQNLASSIRCTKIEMEEAVKSGVASLLVTDSLNSIHQIYQRFREYDPFDEEEDED